MRADDLDAQEDVQFQIAIVNQLPRGGQRVDDVVIIDENLSFDKVLAQRLFDCHLPIGRSRMGVQVDAS